MNAMTRTRPKSHATRTGVAVVEAAVTTGATLLILVALLDLGLAALRYNSLGHACRSLARTAALRGAETLDGAQVLGPSTLAGHAGDASFAAAQIQPFLATMNPADVAYVIAWPEVDNGPGDPVLVELHFTHHPLLSGLSPWGPLPLKAVSTMRVVH